MRFNFDAFTLEEIREAHTPLFPDGEWNNVIAAFLVMYYFVNGEMDQDQDESVNASTGLLGGFICYRDIHVYPLTPRKHISHSFGSDIKYSSQTNLQFCRCSPRAESTTMLRRLSSKGYASFVLRRQRYLLQSVMGKCFTHTKS